jgi:Transposase DDE domain
VRFPQSACLVCHLHSQCTVSRSSRTISLHPDESLFQELRQRQITASGRQKLRERVSVEHTLAHISQWQGKEARYLGLRKNLFDLRRMAVVYNLHILARILTEHQEISA